MGADFREVTIKALEIRSSVSPRVGGPAPIANAAITMPPR